MIGMILGNRYEIIETIDSGGMAYIYKAHCRKNNCIVAVKVLKEEFTTSTEYVNRFKKEAEAAFSLNHDHVVSVTDVGFDQGAYYMVMEYVEGSSLKTLIDETPLAEADAIQYAIEICSALSAAHKKGIIHRDIKPQNILLTKDGIVKVTDFGIAKSISSEDDSDNQAIGSVYYISPEQAKGSKVDVRTDIYSLGIVLYEMLTGTVPYTGDKTVAIALKHINEQITQPKQKNEKISAAINNVVLKATSKNKKDRYRSMKDFKEDLIRALIEPEGLFIAPTPMHPTLRTDKNPKKHRMWKFAIFLVLIAAVITVIVVGAGQFNGNKEDTFTVPDLVGLSLMTAEQRQVKENFSIEVAYENSETVDENVVISQHPEGGSQNAGDTKVSLVVSSGPADVLMPDVIGLSEAEAVEQLESMGLFVEDVMIEPQEEEDPGYVISQIPEAGSVVAASDVISLVVTGEYLQNGAPLPDMLGTPLDKAIDLLNESGFSNLYIYQDESEAEGSIVVEQSPEGGVQTAYTEDIYLTISKYIEQRYTGRFDEEINVPEKESRIKVVLEEDVAGYTVNFVIHEDDYDAGIFQLTLTDDMKSVSAGLKNVKLFINDIEIKTFSIEFYERSDIVEG